MLNVHCVCCGRYVRPNSPQRYTYAGYEDRMLCRNCERRTDGYHCCRCGADVADFATVLYAKCVATLWPSRTATVPFPRLAVVGAS